MYIVLFPGLNSPIQFKILQEIMFGKFTWKILYKNIALKRGNGGRGGGPTPIGKKYLKQMFVDILTWIGEFRPGNKTIWVVFDEESDVLGPRMHFLSLDRVA